MVVQVTQGGTSPPSATASVAADSYVELAHNKNIALPVIKASYLEDSRAKDVENYPLMLRQVKNATKFTDDAIGNAITYDHHRLRGCELGNGKFVIGWYSTTAPNPHIGVRILDPSNSYSAVDLTDIENVASNTKFLLSGLRSTNKFVIVYVKTDNKLYFQIFDHDGTNIKSETVVTDSIRVADVTPGTFFGCASKSDGTFMIVWRDSSTAGNDFNIYNSSGTKTLGTTNIQATYGQLVHVRVLSPSDYFCIVTTSTSPAGAGDYYIYNGTSKVVGPINFDDNLRWGNTGSCLRVRPLPDDGFAIIFEDQGGTNRATITSYQYNGDSTWTQVAQVDPFGNGEMAAAANPVVSHCDSFNTFYIGWIGKTPIADSAGLYFEAYEGIGLRSLYAQDQTASRFTPRGAMTYSATATGLSSLYLIGLSNRKVAVVFGNALDSNKGYFLVLQGTWFKKSIVDNNKVRVYNYTGKTQTVRVSCVGW